METRPRRFDAAAATRAGGRHEQPSLSELRSRLERIVGADHVRADAGALLTFATDATPLERARKYGITRDYVLGVEAVLAAGEVIRSGGRLVKDVAGYDLRRLLCGSEGTLAVLTELTLRLVPAPEASGTGLAYFPALADAA